MADLPASEDTIISVETAKKLVSDIRHRIELDDLITRLCRQVIAQTTDERFPVENVDVSAERVAERLKNYEEATDELQNVLAIVCHWGLREHHGTVQKVLARLVEAHNQRNGLVAWLGLRLYPATFLLYSGGIAALAGGRYDNLAALLTTSFGGQSPAGSQSVLVEIGDAFAELERVNPFRLLDEHSEHRVPRSEYLYKRLQPKLDDLLFLGRSYEPLFDRFEILLALVHADQRVQDRRHVWGPIGRFGWKHRNGDAGPYISLVKEAEVQGESWPPIVAGLFGHSIERFSNLAQHYQQVLDNLGWY